MKVLTVAVFLIGLFNALAAGPKMGKAKSIEFSKIESCDYKNVLKTSYTIKFDPATKLASGDISTPFDIDTNVMFAINLMKQEDDGNWKSMQNTTSSFCKFATVGCPTCVKGLTSNLGVKEIKDCFIPKGKYNMKDFSVSLKDIVATVPFGNFKGDMILTKDKKQVACILFQVKIEG